MSLRPVALAVTLVASPWVASADAPPSPQDPPPATTGMAAATEMATAPQASAAAVVAPAASVPFAPGEQIDVTIDYLHMRTGQARLVVGRPEGAVWPVICQAKTEGVATLLDIREHYVSYWDADARMTRGSDLNAIEVGDRHTDRARFDRENGKAMVQVIRKGKAHESTHDVPRDVHDLASALMFLRMQTLAPGAHFEFPVFSGTDIFTLRADVEGNEAVDTPAGHFDTLRIKVRLGFKNKFKTNRDSHMWLSNDLRHIPVRMSADFAVGSVTVTLTGYRPGGQFAAR
ncbi:MAG TPA: DUF3108 domain-containing protein [Anaeromyxobacteraceae bacterium]